MNPQIQAAFNTALDTMRLVILREVESALMNGARSVTAPKPKQDPHGRPWQTRAERAKGAKRAAADIAALVDDLQAHIAKTPGQRIEQISGDLGVPSKELFLPVKKLIAANRIRTVGQRRSTKYYPRGGK